MSREGKVTLQVHPESLVSVQDLWSLKSQVGKRQAGSGEEAADMIKGAERLGLECGHLLRCSQESKRQRWSAPTLQGFS